MLKDFVIVKNQLFSEDLPFHSVLFEHCEKVSNILENEITSYRPVAKSGEPGSLLDFRNNPLPTIIVPDIHARPDFIYNILKYRLPESIINYSDRSVFHALKKGLIRIICVGDALHTEKTQMRWARIQKEFEQGISTGPEMSAEMQEGLNTILSLMKLKILFPEYFHFLKGNHENILNKTGNGDYGFVKYANEGNMVKKFLFDMYGDDVIYLISCIENSLPLISMNNKFVVSHAEPRDFYSRDTLINARENPKIVEGLTWTNNDAAKEGSVFYILKEAAESTDISNWYYFGGHRPVKENYQFRQEGKYVQFHNPVKQNILFIKPEESIDLDKILINVDKRRKRK